jgi:hypothetical protein
MAATASAASRPAGQAGFRLPPEERFWQRYSPHWELPLSGAGSFTLHALCAGALVLGVVLAIVNKPKLTLPVEPVHFDAGGGGKADGSGDGEGVGLGSLVDAGESADQEQPGKVEAPPRPALTPVERDTLPQQFDDGAERYLRQNETEQARAYVRLDSVLRDKARVRDVSPGKGKGGLGKGGGEGEGTGTGKGAGQGPGKGPPSRATLNQREKRMLRWNMRFPANSAQEYLEQLRRLGAILAIPMPGGQYQVIHDLRRRPAQPVEEDVAKLNRIFWIDDNPQSVPGVLRALGLPQGPRRFVAFMPQELEKSLYDMEKRHMRQRYGFYNEDRIYETRFRVEPALGYKVVVIAMTLKAPGQR